MPLMSERDRIQGMLYEEVHPEAVKRVGERAYRFRILKDTDDLLKRVKACVKGYEENRKLLDGETQLALDFSLEPERDAQAGARGYEYLHEATQRFASELASLTLLLVEREFGLLHRETKYEKEDRERKELERERKNLGLDLKPIADAVNEQMGRPDKDGTTVEATYRV